ncbi:MAG: HEAT repeat domain-containing protein [Moraxellaceae bacterium]|nr:HEAT repeat domain-containing protein [Moraxellaceae bacterium]
MQNNARPVKGALLWVGAIALGLLSGCAINMKVPLKDPAPSTAPYAKQAPVAPTSLSFKDERPTADRGKLMTGFVPMQLMYKDKPFDPVPYVAENTVKELTARGIPVQLAADGKGAQAVGVKYMHIELHRASGFSPFVTFTSLRADIDTPQGPQRVTAYVKRGKVPVWTFDEIIDPTFNEPMSILTKELAAKINQRVYGQAATDDQVAGWVANINKNGTTQEAVYHDVYQLGFGNNPKAVPELVKLTKHSAEYIRLAAISSLGILRANDQFGLLKSLFEDKTVIWQDRAMALKAIGDLGSAESRDYLQKEWKRVENLSDKESAWNKEIIGLYL